MSTQSFTNLNTPGSAPQVPNVNPQSQALAAAQTHIGELKSKVATLTSRIDHLETGNSELQLRDAESQQTIQRLTLWAEYMDTCYDKTRADLDLLLKAVGVELEQQPVRTGEPAESHLTPGFGVEAVGEASSTIAPRNAPDIKPNTKDTSLRKIVIATLASIYGVDHFSLAHHGEYPPVSRSDLRWPFHMDGGKRVTLHRFDFNEAYDSAKNRATYEEWINVSLTQGPTLARVPAPPPESFTKAMVASQCKQYYATQKSRFKSTASKRAAPPLPLKRRLADTEVEDGESNINSLGLPQSFSYVEYLLSGSLASPATSQSDRGLPSHPTSTETHAHAPETSRPVTPQSFGTATSGRFCVLNGSDNIRSRKVAKCKVRREKLLRLPPDLKAKYASPKYESYFTVGAMSEDEEVIDETYQDGSIKSTHFESHAYEWISDEMNCIRNNLEGVPDPSSSIRTRRVRGEPKTGEPHPNSSVEGGMRTWMVQAEVLKENPEWTERMLVYPSGPEWGESEPSNPRAAQQAKKKVRVTIENELTVIRDANMKMQQARAKLENFDQGVM